MSEADTEARIFLGFIPHQFYQAKQVFDWSGRNQCENISAGGVSDHHLNESPRRVVFELPHPVRKPKDSSVFLPGEDHVVFKICRRAHTVRLYAHHLLHTLLQSIHWIKNRYREDVLTADMWTVLAWRKNVDQNADQPTHQIRDCIPLPLERY